MLKSVNMSKFVLCSRCSAVQKKFSFSLLQMKKKIACIEMIWSELKQSQWHYMHVNSFKSNMLMYCLYELVYKAYSVYAHSARNMKNIFIFFQLNVTSVLLHFIVWMHFHPSFFFCIYQGFFVLFLASLEGKKRSTSYISCSQCSLWPKYAL